MQRVFKAWQHLNKGSIDGVWGWLANVLAACKLKQTDNVYFEILRGYYARFDPDEGWAIWTGVWKRLNPAQQDVDRYFVPIRSIERVLKAKDLVDQHGGIGNVLSAAPSGVDPDVLQCARYLQKLLKMSEKHE